MKNYLLFLLILTSFKFYSQSKNKLPYTFGKVNLEELIMEVYEKDSTANAVVLYEHGNTIFINNGSQIYIKTTFYKKIKILNDSGKKHATISIYLYNDKDDGEKIKNVKAQTFDSNGRRISLKKEHIYTTRINENVKEVTFTFPNVNPGSVLEYQYDLESDFFFNFTGWTFQSEIPKIYSEFHAIIPGFWLYNRHLNGSLRLYKNKAELKKNCFSIGNNATASCEDLTYAMKDIPAYIEEEDFSTDKSNYISKIKFELSQINYTDGRTKKYTSSWKDTDLRLKQDKNVGNQIRKNRSFFENNIPQDLISNSNNPLKKSQDIYEYIQNHFSLNEDKNYIFKNVNVKTAFKEKIGSVSEINLSLINALKAADIDARIFMLSTRDNGFPTKLHPVMTDFNYILAHVIVNNKTYLLDASDKFMPFGMIPFKTLNSYGRVMNFEIGSYWQDITPKFKTSQRTYVNLKLINDSIKGNLKTSDAGYFALNKRKEIRNLSEDKYLLNIENEFKNISVKNYKNLNVDNLNESLKEEYEIELEGSEFVGNLIFINPFLSTIENNPFQLKERTYPVDFGYKFNNTYIAVIEIPEEYIIKEIPKSITVNLPEKGGSFTAKIKNTENKISIYTNINLVKTIYQPQEYPYLKELFSQIIKTQNSLITLEKI